MSVKVMNAVFERYPHGGGEMVLALALADHADEDGRHIFPSVKRLAIKTRQSERTVQYQLRKMEEATWLLLVAHGSGGRGYAREYCINPAWLKGEELAPFANEQKGANPAPISDDAAPVDESVKGAEVAPFTNGERVQSEAERVQSTTQRVQSDAEKGATAIAPQPSVTVIEPSEKKSGARQARTSATGSVTRINVTVDDMTDSLPGLSREAAAEYLAYRKHKRALLTPLAWKTICAEIGASGWQPDSALVEAMNAGWVGAKAEWLINRSRNQNYAGQAASHPSRGTIHEQRAAIIAGLTGQQPGNVFDGFADQVD